MRLHFMAQKGDNKNDNKEYNWGLEMLKLSYNAGGDVKWTATGMII